MVFEFTNFQIRSFELLTNVQVVSSQGQSSGIKTDGAFLPRILLSGFLLVSVVGDSAFPGLQTSVRRGTVPFTLRRALPHRGAITAAAGLWCPAGEPALFTLLRELPVRGAGETAAPATRVVLATHVVPPLGIFCSVSDQNLSESVALSSSPCLH